MFYVSNLIKEYVGKSFEIDCYDIEIHRKEDNNPPIFKGPGIIKSDLSGPLSFKIYNQAPITIETINYLKKVREGKDSEAINVRLFATDYDGVKWTGGWSIPDVNFYKSQNVVVHGEFTLLSTRLDKLKTDETHNVTELIFAERFGLPFKGAVHEKRCHGDEVVSTSTWHDHHDISFKGSDIIFQESSDKSRTHVKATSREGFVFPFSENWIIEALTFVTAKNVYPRMIIRHFDDSAQIFIRQTPKNNRSHMPPPFFREHSEDVWNLFLSYLSKCEEIQSFEPMELSIGFSELIHASVGTHQAFLMSLTPYIENCLEYIFKQDDKGRDSSEDIDAINKYVSDWTGNAEIKKRALGLLTILNKPHTAKRMELLIASGVIREEHKKAWNKTRHPLAHGGYINISTAEKFWYSRNYLISMVYRLLLRILGFKGKVLDYNGEKFHFVDFHWENYS